MVARTSRITGFLVHKAAYWQKFGAEFTAISSQLLGRTWFELPEKGKPPREGAFAPIVPGF